MRKEDQKTTNYDSLTTELRRMYGLFTVFVVPIVVGSLGVVSSRLAGNLKKLGIGDVVGGLQTSAIIGTAAILRKVLNQSVTLRFYSPWVRGRT